MSGQERIAKLQEWVEKMQKSIYVNDSSPPAVTRWLLLEIQFVLDELHRREEK